MNSIVLPARATSTEQEAAGELQRYWRELFGKQLPIVRDSAEGNAPSVWIGETRLCREIGVDLSGLEEDGFEIRTSVNHLVIAGGGRKGTLFGVYTFLEKYLGVRYYSADCLQLPLNPPRTLPQIRDRQVP